MTLAEKWFETIDGFGFPRIAFKQLTDVGYVRL